VYVCSNRPYGVTDPNTHPQTTAREQLIRRGTNGLCWPTAPQLHPARSRGAPGQPPSRLTRPTFPTAPSGLKPPRAVRASATHAPCRVRRPCWTARRRPARDPGRTASAAGGAPVGAPALWRPAPRRLGLSPEWTETSAIAMARAWRSRSSGTRRGNRSSSRHGFTPLAGAEPPVAEARAESRRTGLAREAPWRDAGSRRPSRGEAGRDGVARAEWSGRTRGGGCRTGGRRRLQHRTSSSHATAS
jgi:hypothetical protein